jgi:hypothetical protein
MGGAKQAGIAKVVGIGIVAVGIALGAVAPAAATVQVKGFDAGDRGGPVGTRKVDLYELDDAASTARPHQGRFGIGFVAE